MTEYDWVDLINEIKVSAKRAGVASGRADWKKFREAMKEVADGLEKVKKQYPSYYEKAKQMAQTQARRAVGKNPMQYNPYMGFKKLTAKLKKRGAYDPKALAAWIGRKNYSKSVFQKMALAGKRKKGRIIRGVKFGKKKYKIAANTKSWPKGITPWIIYGVVGYFAYRFWFNKAVAAQGK